MDKTEKMNQIKTELLNLKDSPLLDYRLANKYFPVIGEGNHNARIIFIGEAPGKNEALSGRPFCGRAGKVLDELLTSVGLKREEVYITNIVKDRPPANRDPLPTEIDFYAPFLDRQIEIIKPKVIVPLGRFSCRYVLNLFSIPEADQTIGEVRGRIFKTSAEEIHILPLFHPAACIYNPKLKEVLVSDFQKLKDFI